MIRKREEKARRIYVVAHLLLLQEVPLALREGSSGSGENQWQHEAWDSAATPFCLCKRCLLLCERASPSGVVAQKQRQRPIIHRIRSPFALQEVPLALQRAL